jgi:hypothetical protein
LGINPRGTYKPHFKTLETWTMPSQYIFFLMEYLVNNMAYFALNRQMYNKLSRNRKCHVPQVNFSLYQKCVYYMRIKVFDSLLNWRSDLVQNKKIF